MNRRQPWPQLRQSAPGVITGYLEIGSSTGCHSRHWLAAEMPILAGAATRIACWRQSTPIAGALAPIGDGLSLEERLPLVVSALEGEVQVRLDSRVGRRPADQEVARGVAQQLVRRALRGDRDLVGPGGCLLLMVKLNVPGWVGLPVIMVVVPGRG